MIRSTIAAALLAASASTSLAAPTTWYINQPWDFYTSSIPAQGNLVGSITFDRDVSIYYPLSWSFTFQHHDPIFTPYYPLTINGTYPNASNYQHTGWLLWGGPVAGDYLAITFNLTDAVRNTLMDGGPEPVSFAAYEYVYRGVNSSTRMISNGWMSTVPTPGATALLMAGGAIATRRRRR
ncbi:MAG TPA: hypothetical protein VD997_13505 [Phycisphaerales bacterium]|nr:hypothetical protein [Phycisphaerales bacterium]